MHQPEEEFVVPALSYNQYISHRASLYGHIAYCQTSNISCTKSKTLNVSRLVVFAQSIEASC